MLTIVDFNYEEIEMSTNHFDKKYLLSDVNAFNKVYKVELAHTLFAAKVFVSNIIDTHVFKGSGYTV